jgi:GntR family transcriptional regulator
MQTQASRVRGLVDASLKNGIYAMNEPLVEDVLMQSLGASRTAVRDALRSLAEQGLLTRKRRVGTVPVNTGTRIRIDDISYRDPDDARIDLDVQIKIVDWQVVPASALVKSVLHTDEAEVRVCENLYLRGGVVIGNRTAYYSTQYDPPVDGVVDMTAIARNVFGVRDLHVAWTEIGTAKADPGVCRLFGMVPDSVVLTRCQAFVDEDGNPVQVVFDHYHPDMVTFVSD